jgi:hypothetical protein
MAKEKQRLKIDVDALFPAETVEIGVTKVEIRPLGFRELTSLMRKLRSYGELFSKEEITWENFNQTENVVTIAYILMENAPHIIAEASNIEEEDILELPIEYVFDIVSTVVDVNMKSKEKLEKNWKSLAEKLGMVAEAAPKSKK